MTRHSVAVIGANGFIGNRIVEILHLGGEHDVRPVVRAASALALASRFGIEGRIANGLDQAALAEALRDCDIVVHVLAGDRRTIIRTIDSVYQAAAQAQCQRLIYLSTAMVHGQSPAEGTDERSPLSQRQSMAYNVSKVIAEKRLFELRHSGRVEVVALRPGIVYGPRSQWIGGLADSIIASEAYLIDGGTGLCNAIYVDNVVDAVVRSFDAAGVDGQAFLLGERNAPSWHEVYHRVAAAIGRDVAEIPHLGFEERKPRLIERLDQLRQSRPVKAVTRSMPRFLSDGLAAFWAASGAGPISPPTGPNPTLEMALLHRSRHLPSWEKARAELGYDAPVGKDEAWHRTIAWLSFAGYPTGKAPDG